MGAEFSLASAASVRYRIAIGPGTGRRTLTFTNPGLAQSLASERLRLPRITPSVQVQVQAG